jgi:hypothetical protein
MRFIVRIVAVLALLSLLPRSGSAQQAQTEVATAQINITALGISFIGTAVSHRTLGTNPLVSTWSFKGMINNHPADMSGKAEERWTSDGEAVVTLTEILSWNTSLPRPITKVYVVHQVSAGLVYVNNIPFAINGWLLFPGKSNQPDTSGATNAPGFNNRPYIITMAGQGIQPVATLPNTSGVESLLFNPYLFTLALVGGGVLLILISRLLRDRKEPARTPSEEA